MHLRARAAGMEVSLDPNTIRTVVPPHQEAQSAVQGRGPELLEPRGGAGLQ